MPQESTPSPPACAAHPCKGLFTALGFDHSSIDQHALFLFFSAPAVTSILNPPCKQLQLGSCGLEHRCELHDCF